MEEGKTKVAAKHETVKDWVSKAFAYGVMAIEYIYIFIVRELKIYYFF